jgi:hypothetical protein
MFSELDRFVSETVIASNNKATSSIVAEVRYESYMTFYCLVKSFSACIDSLNSSKTALTADLNSYVLSRNAYEHQMLKSWIAELYQTRQNKSSDDPLSAPIQFISTYFFGVSDDPELDGVPKSSCLLPGLTDVEDMRIDSKALRSLAVNIVKVRQDVEKCSSMSVFEILTDVVKRALESGVVLPNSWRSMKRLTAMHESLSTSSGDYSLSENVDLFFQHLVMRLALGFLEHAPSSAFIAKLGLKLFTNVQDATKSTVLSSASETIVDLVSITAAIKQDKVLKLGWWNSTVKVSLLEAHTSAVVEVIEAVALMCASVASIGFAAADNRIESASVSFDTFVVLLTKNFTVTNEELNIFQKCLSSSVSFDEEQIAAQKLQASTYPVFVNEGLTKLCNVVAAVVEADSVPLAHDALSTFEQKLYGSLLSTPKKKWLESTLQLSDETLGTHNITAGDVFRNVQKKKNLSFSI